MHLLSIGNCPLDANQGSGYVMLGYANGLRSRGWHVDGLGSEHIDPWPALGRARGLRIAAGMWHAARRALARAEYDVVEFYGGEAWLAIAELARRRDRRFLIVSHSNGLEPAASADQIRWLGADTLDGRPRRWWQSDGSPSAARGFRAADAIVTVSQRERDYAIAAGYQPAERVLAIDNPLPDDWLGDAVDLNRPQVIGFVGSWLPRKGIATIVADLPTVLDEFRDARLELVGVGHSFRASDWFPASVVDRVSIVPFLTDRAALRAVYERWSIAISPSVYESFGLAAVEAMACGCALVASRTGYAAGLADGREARLLDAPTTPHLRGALRTLLADDGLRRAIASAGHARVQALRWGAAIESLATAYERWRAARRAA